ncbi:MBL fold metallo-hydrolase [Gammaproteobacteria bacterium]|nr:MBL fold metallo-hydrolase [Gammaproteobacteria bacterium]
MLDYHIIPVTPLEQNCSLLTCQASGESAIVDPGGDVEVILKAIKEQNADVRQILITHCHFDHVGGVAALARALGVPVVGSHQDDQPLIDALPQFAAMFGIDPPESFTPDRWLREGDTVTIGEQTLNVHFCPGHAPGHVIYVAKASRLAIVGDVLFDGSVGRTDLPMSDPQALLDSLRRHILPLDDDITFLPGHGPRSTIGEQRRRNPFLQQLLH